MIHPLTHNNETILVEDNFITKDFSWDDKDNVIMTTPEQEKEERIAREVRDCGKPITYINPKNGELVEIEHRRCKHYRECEQCAKWKCQQEEEILKGFVGSTRLLIVDIKEEKNITRKYGKENIRRIPIEDNKTAFIIKTDEEVGDWLSHRDCERLSQHAIPSDGRRISGRLGKAPTAPKGEPNEPLELETDNVECHHREFRVKFDSKIEGAPKDYNELRKMYQEQVEILDNPASSEGALQQAILIVENKIESICLMYGMSFYFLSKTITRVKLSEVEWKWLGFEKEMEQLDLKL